MTSLVAIQCTDGVVIAADSSATFGDGGQVRTIEQQTSKKIEIIGNSNRMIVAGTGYVGHHLRFVESVRLAHAKKEFESLSPMDVMRHLSKIGISDFGKTTPAHLLHTIPYSSFVAYKSANKLHLCELTGSIAFQPEIKQVDDLWFTSSGSGQSITDPFLALFRSIFWAGGAPDTNGGIFTAYWALSHACEVNPGGVNYPVKIAVLGRKGSAIDAWMLNDDELLETKDLVKSATEHFAGFKDVLLGKLGTRALPKVPNI